MRTYIAPVSLALVVIIAGLYFFIDQTKTTLGPHKPEDVAIDSEARKHFSSIAEKYASEASETSGVSKN